MKRWRNIAATAEAAYATSTRSAHGFVRALARAEDGEADGVGGVARLSFRSTSTGIAVTVQPATAKSKVTGRNGVINNASTLRAPRAPLLQDIHIVVVAQQNAAEER